MARVCTVVTHTLNLPPDLRPTGPDAQLYGQGMGLDSLDALSLVAALEKEFDVVIPGAELTPASFQTIGSVVTLLERLKQAS